MKQQIAHAIVDEHDFVLQVRSKKMVILKHRSRDVSSDIFAYLNPWRLFASEKVTRDIRTDEAELRMYLGLAMMPSGFLRIALKFQ